MLNRPTLPPVFWPGILGVAGVKLLLHLFVNTIYGFHRDELLYLALGRHPDWGYWSNPPLIGWLGWIIEHTGDGPLWAVRLLPTLASCMLVGLAGVMARELGGKRYAQFLAAAAVAVAPAYLRTGMLYQPVVFDVLGWAALCYLLLRYLNTENRRYLWYFGLVFGLAFLNKYMVGFLLLALVPALLLTPARNVLWKKDTLIAAGLALLVISPNLLWQYVHHFPVVNHMQALRANQLVHVEPGSFLKDQVLMLFTASLVWVPGLWALASLRRGAYRPLLLLFIGVIVLLLAFQGKAYYTLGIYPVALAGGGVFWEKNMRNRTMRAALPLAMLALLLPLLPLAIPLYPPAKMAAYCQWVGQNLGLTDVNRWEDGRTYPLPQDYADMLGWPELGRAAIAAYRQLPPGTPVLVYGENYGQAGAVDYFGRLQGLPPAVSFSDTYRLWIPDSISAQALIYINDDLGRDVHNLFADIRPIGSITDSLAREFGTTVYLCRQPRQDLDQFWRERVKIVRSQ